MNTSHIVTYYIQTVCCWRLLNKYTVSFQNIFILFPKDFHLSSFRLDTGREKLHELAVECFRYKFCILYINWLSNQSFSFYLILTFSFLDLNYKEIKNIKVNIEVIIWIVWKILLNVQLIHILKSAANRKLIFLVLDQFLLSNIMSVFIHTIFGLQYKSNRKERKCKNKQLPSQGLDRWPSRSEVP